MGCGRRRIEWTKELDNKLLAEIEKGSNYTELTTRFKISSTTISKRLKEMGFEGLVDARRVMCG